MWDKKLSGETVLGLIWGRAMVSRRLGTEERPGCREDVSGSSGEKNRGRER